MSYKPYYFNNSQQTIVDKIPEIKNLLLHSQYNISTLDFNGRFISNITPGDMNSSISMSIDHWNRIYVSFRIEWYDHLHKIKGTDVYTLFQKDTNTHINTDQNSNWSIKTTGKDILQIYDTPFIKNGQQFNWKPHVYKALKELLLNGRYRSHMIDLRLV